MFPPSRAGYEEKSTPNGWDDANVNLITYDSINDPISGFPLLKAIPVSIEKMDYRDGTSKES